MKTAIIIQARMTSTRLPGKILKMVLDKPLLEYQIERLKRVNRADQIIIATTINETDNPIVDLCNKMEVPFYRGSEQDVLARYYYAAREKQADVIVRVTSDCPLIDPQVIDKVIGFYLNHKSDCDYVANVLERTYPRGMDTEVFSFQGLEEAFREAVDPPEREHVTPFFYRHPERYRLSNVAYHENQSQHRWTVDTIEDFLLIKNIIEELYPSNPTFTFEDVLRVLDRNPEWISINAGIEQKEI